MAKHKFILEGSRDGAATLWYISGEGRMFPVKHFTKEDQEDDDAFEVQLKIAALAYKVKYL